MISLEMRSEHWTPLHFRKNWIIDFENCSRTSDLQCAEHNRANRRYFFICEKERGFGICSYRVFAAIASSRTALWKSNRTPRTFKFASSNHNFRINEVIMMNGDQWFGGVVESWSFVKMSKVVCREKQVPFSFFRFDII